tara:strand:+ start:1917 stop:3122 length:1206 start_codon:yes stop_codon:yes gene_type:complete
MMYPKQKARLGLAALAHRTKAGASQAAGSHCKGAKAQNQTKPAKIAFIQSRLLSTGGESDQWKLQGKRTLFTHNFVLPKGYSSISIDPTPMKEVRIGKSTLRGSRLAFGCWRIAGTWEARKVNAKARESGLKAILAAYETGYTLFDLADIYCEGISEELFGLALKQSKSLKKSAVIATKCGIRIPEAGETYRYDLSANYIIQSCENSLQRLGVDCLDIYQLHRPDWLMDPNEVAKAFAKLKKAGKVRHFGISNFKPSQVSLLQSALKDSLVVNQIEISLLQLASFEDGTLDQCQQHKITPMAWSPLAGGYLGDGKSNVLPSQEKYKPIKIRRRLDTLARELGTSRSAIALAWLLKHPSGIIPIIGTTKPSRIRELAEADQIELSHEQWYTLLTSALKEDLP